MIPFQHHTFLKVLTTRGEVEAPGLSFWARRLRLLTTFPLVAGSTAGLLALDRLLYPFEQVQVEKPLFIVGSPRSGSTMLFRLLAQDEGRFTSFRTWQLLAPAVSSQKLVRWLERLDQQLGGRGEQQLNLLQARIFQRADRFHRIRLQEPEEDEFLLTYAFATEILANLFPVPEALLEYRQFDGLSDARRQALMHFYKTCIQRLLYVEGPERQLLSKSPLFSHKVKSLAETFPDGRFVLLVRHPAETCCSLVSMIRSYRKYLGLEEHLPGHTSDENIIRFMVDCYMLAIQALETLPPERYQLVRYEELLANPKEVVLRLYQALSLEVTPEFHARLEVESQRILNYRTTHQHSAERLGLSEALVEQLAGPVYDRFGYARRATA